VGSDDPTCWKWRHKPRQGGGVFLYRQRVRLGAKDCVLAAHKARAGYGAVYTCGGKLGRGRQLRRAVYSFSYPHLFISPTFQQPVSMQASYRFWQIRCVPQCKRACEQVARCWAHASLEDIAINGTPTVATRTALKIKRVMTSGERSLLRPALFLADHLVLQRKRADCRTASPVIAALGGQNANRQSEHERGGSNHYAFGHHGSPLGF
jgi:hypothetical protein